MNKLKFVGYDVGNRMVYVKSYVNHMFPCNGSLVKTERHIMKTSGQTFVSTTLLKDGHTFSIHVVDPMTPDELRLAREEEMKQMTEVKNKENQADMENPSKVSLNATLTNNARKSGKASGKSRFFIK